MSIDDEIDALHVAAQTMAKDVESESGIAAGMGMPMCLMYRALVFIAEGKSSDPVAFAARARTTIDIAFDEIQATAEFDQLVERVCGSDR